MQVELLNAQRSIINYVNFWLLFVTVHFLVIFPPVLLLQIVTLSLTKTIEKKFNFTLGKTFRVSLLCKLVRVKRSKVSRCFVHWLLNHCFPNYDKKQKFFFSFSFYFLPFQKKKVLCVCRNFFCAFNYYTHDKKMHQSS